MKENAYDNESFFEQYSHFPRSIEGLRGAGEWHELRRMMPELKGKRVLDLGCGFGWHCRYAAEQGAVAVLGTDLSEKMLVRAAELTDDPHVTYCRVAMEDLEVEAEAFDVVISSLALHYIEDLELVFKKVWNALPVGGHFLFSCEHPVFTAQGSQDWYSGGGEEHLHWPVDNYFSEGKRMSRFLGCDVVKYHRTLTTYLGTLFKLGFHIQEVVEPRPDPALMDVPGMSDELRRPMMLLVSAKKQK